jgi:hypothetical protein
MPTEDGVSECMIGYAEAIHPDEFSTPRFPDSGSSLFQ